MPVIITLDQVLQDRGLSGKDVAKRVGLSETQLSLIRSNKVRGIRFSTLARLCHVLECATGELFGYSRDDDDMA